MFSLSVTDPGSDVQAPVIVIGPKDTTVVAGIQATLECVANARYVCLFICIYLFIYYSFTLSFIHSFTHTHTHTHTQSHTKLYFDLTLAETEKSKHFYTVCCQIHTHTYTHIQRVYWRVGVLTSQSFLSFCFSQTAANYSSVRNRQKLNREHFSFQLNIRSSLRHSEHTFPPLKFNIHFKCIP